MLDLRELPKGVFQSKKERICLGMLQGCARASKGGQWHRGCIGVMSSGSLGFRAQGLGGRIKDPGVSSHGFSIPVEPSFLCSMIYPGAKAPSNSVLHF